MTPLQVVRQKWHESRRNLAVNDIVLVHEKSPIKGKYVLAVVESVNESKDGLVRSCTVSYRIPNSKDAKGLGGSKYSTRNCYDQLEEETSGCYPGDD